MLAVLLVIARLALIALLARLHRPGLLFMSIAAFVFVALSGYAFIVFPGNPAYVVPMGVFFLLGWSVYAGLATRLRRAARWAMRRDRMNAAAPPAP